jgi:hypothetical protein
VNYIQAKATKRFPMRDAAALSGWSHVFRRVEVGAAAAASAGPATAAAAADSAAADTAASASTAAFAAPAAAAATVFSFPTAYASTPTLLLLPAADLDAKAAS